MNDFKVGDIVRYNDALPGEEDLRFMVTDAYGDCLEIRQFPPPNVTFIPKFREHVKHFERV